MMMDDTDDPRIDALCDFYVLRGLLSPTRLSRLWSAPQGLTHALFRVNRPVRT